MKLNYILSDTTSGATTAALKQVTKLAQDDCFSNVIVLVPEPKSIAIERELLNNAKNNAFSNIFIYSFVRLLSRIGKIEESELVSKQTCVMILRKIILDNLDKLTCYKKTAKTIGFAEKIYDTIQQFKSSSYTLEDVKVLAQNSSGALKSKMADIAFLFEEYEKVLSQGLIDDCDRLRRLGELAKTSEFLKASDVFIVGFDNVTNDMIAVLKELACNCKSITFSCVYFNENRKDKYIQNNELFHKFASIATKLNYPYNPRFVNSQLKGDFWNIQNYLFSTEQKSVSSAGNVQVFELETKQKELDFLANQILSEVKQGKRFKDIAVIDADFEKDIQLIAKSFDEHEIPYFITKSYDISRHFFVNFIKNTIEVFVSNFSSEKVLKWLSSPLFEIDCYSEFVNFVKQFGINWNGFFSHATSSMIENEFECNKINQIIDLMVKLNAEFAEVFSSENTISCFISAVERLAVFVEAEKKLEEISGFERENSLDVEAEVTNAIMDKFSKLNRNLAKFLGDKKVSPTEFLQIYLSGFSEEEVNIVPVSVDCVLIQKNSDGLYNIKDLFIIGASDGNLPIKMSDTGILQDAELNEFKNLCGKAIEPTIKDINNRGKFETYEFLLLPKEKLFVSYSTKAFGSTNKPSNIIKRLVRLFNLEIQKDYKTIEFTSPKTAELQFARHVGEFLSNESISHARINDEYNKLRSFMSENFLDVIDNLSFDNREFVINEAKDIFFANNKTSVSQLETYFTCPYSFFAKYGLRLKENKDASLSSLDIGTIVHKFAELVTKNIRDLSELKDDQLDVKARELLAKSLEILQINTQKNAAILSFVADEAVRLAKYLIAEQLNSSFKNDPNLNEFSFYGNNAVRLKIDNDTVISVEGKIDRIDKFGDYIRIIDYKTGATDSGLDSIYFGKKIQLVSYLSASEKIGNQKIAGLFYFPIHSDFVKFEQKTRNNYKMQGFLLDDIDIVKYMDSAISLENNESEFVPLKIKTNKECRESGDFQISYGRTKNYLSAHEFDAVKNYTELLCMQAASEILSGFIEPSPIAKLSQRESSVCASCELRGACGREYARFGEARRCGGDINTNSFETKEDDNVD